MTKTNIEMKTLLKKLKHYFSGEHEKNKTILIILFELNKEKYGLLNYWCLNNTFAINFKNWTIWNTFNIYNPLDKGTWKLLFNLGFTPDRYFNPIPNQRTREEKKSLMDKKLSILETMVVREISLEIRLLFIEFTFSFNFDYLLKYELSEDFKEIAVKYYRVSSLNIKSDDDWNEYRLKNNIL